ncbi:N-acyl-D-amino-acid deacylase family protein [Amycolatopsis jejuensis]|uniref:N-acyl-D-amino-acid deacylase family protein n=1 Tax=Amycolatopsis jejuensis TaxID=330084 RepID=UPI000527AD0F|nr:D-aminoacylase [Amycolatopsis jejuensis]
MPADLVIRGGSVVDGTGGPARLVDVAIAGDRIEAVGEVPETDVPELDAAGCVVAPGFINVLSHAYETLQLDPRGLSDLYQGVTTEVFGEGRSMGPVTGRMTDLVAAEPPLFGMRTSWPRLGDFFADLAAAGLGLNIASFVGAENLRMPFAGTEDRPLTTDELAAACALLDEELADGALGVGSALIYSPGSYASTEELIAYARVLARHDALYISHIRGESDRLVDSVDELIRIARESSARAEIYHLKASGKQNWPLMTTVLERVAQARAEGLGVTADIYPYDAGSTFLSAFIPPRFHEGGHAALAERIADPVTRKEIKAAILDPGQDWENLYLGSGGASGILLLGTGADHLKGHTLAEVSAHRWDSDPLDTLLDLVTAEPKLMVAEFTASETDVRRALQQPWVSVCTDSEAIAAEPPFTDTSIHPRTYGAFARVLGPWVREGVLPLEEAVRRMTSLPASNLRLPDRGVLRPGAFADVTVFDPAAVQDNATYLNPHRYADGMRHVLVNGQAALREGQPTGVLAGRALRRGR